MNLLTRTVLENLIKMDMKWYVMSLQGSGAKKLNDLKMIFQTWLYWYYYVKKVCDQYEKRKYIQMETLS
ncbi:hypothetical protein P4377_27310, partial [Bacillus thuringiensis]|nr:hypothetical protein [Bacillus thuringiensis]